MKMHIPLAHLCFPSLYNGNFPIDHNFKSLDVIEKPNEISFYQNFDTDDKYDYYVIKNCYKKDYFDQLNLYKNDRVKFIKNYDQNYYLVQNLRTKEIGLAPIEHLKSTENILKKDWFFPYLSREDVEKLIIDNPDLPVGYYIVRFSARETLFALTLKLNDKIKNFNIVKLNEKFFVKPESGKPIENILKFDNIESLLDYYKKKKDMGVKLIQDYLKKFSNQKHEIEILEKDIKLSQEVIGAGNYGVVYKGILKNKHEIAAKKSKIDGPINHNLDFYISVFQEINILNILKHEKIVKFYGYSYINNSLYIIMEHMENKSLLEYMRLNPSKINFNVIINMAAQITLGMKYIEEQKVVHRDLAARNILVGQNYLVKIGDVGLAKILLKNETNTTCVRTCKIAPEVFRTRKYTNKTDMWSCGLLLNEMITLGSGDPFKNQLDIARMIQDPSFKIDHPGGMCTNEFYYIILKCMKYDPDERYTFKELNDVFNRMELSLKNK